MANNRLNISSEAPGFIPVQRHVIVEAERLISPKLLPPHGPRQIFSANLNTNPDRAEQIQQCAQGRRKGWWRIAIPSLNLAAWRARNRRGQARIERSEVEDLFERELRDFTNAYIRQRPQKRR